MTTIAASLQTLAEQVKACFKCETAMKSDCEDCRGTGLVARFPFARVTCEYKDATKRFVQGRGKTMEALRDMEKWHADNNCRCNGLGWRVLDEQECHVGLLIRAAYECRLPVSRVLWDYVEAVLEGKSDAEALEAALAALVAAVVGEKA